MIGEGQPSAAEWARAAWKLQSWVRSCFDQVGICTLCGTPDPAAHVNECPWPEMRALLDRESDPRNDRVLPWYR